MKQVFAILAASLLLWSCQEADSKAGEAAGDTKDGGNYTTIQWVDSINQDLGKIKEGQVIEISYRFKNAGEKNLIIEDVRASCGCTVPEKPEKPFAPGEEGVIRAKFDSKGRVGPQNKTVTVQSNTAPQREYYLTFKVEVEAAK